VKLLAVTVNYRTPDMTLRAVGTLLQELGPYPDARVVIVDNNSGDGSVEQLQQGVTDASWSDRVEVQASPWNGGFAWGNNFAIGPALDAPDLPDYVYLLNSDAFPDPDSVRQLVDYLDQNPSIGIAGSYIHGDDGETHRTAFRFPTVASEFETTLGIGVVSRLLRRWIVSPELPTTTSTVDWLAGASMLIRREVLKDVGLMDDGYFLYFEETDFCLRAQRAGWPTVYVVESSVTHIGSVSTGIQDLSTPTPTFWYASRHRYFLKNHGRAILWIANFVYIFGGLVRRLRSFAMRRKSHEPRGHMRDFLRYNLQPGAKPNVHPPRAASPR
jgi:N-acetylglucosaminyl-diphospho-decaprenol L-rhamnosyltransferase